MSLSFTESVVDEALSDARAGKSYDQTDSACAGLTLRVGPRGAGWGYKAMSRGRLHRMAIGPVGKRGERWTVCLDDARIVAAAARRELRLGRELTPEFLRAELVRLDLADPPPPPPPPPDPATEAERARAAAEARLWTLAEGRDAYLAEVKRVRRWDTWNDYRKLLDIEELRFLEKERVCRIKREDLAEVVAAIHASGRERHAEHLASVLRPFWTFLQRDDVKRRSGVTEDMRLLRAPERSAGVRLRANGKRPGGYTATPEEIGVLLACCEEVAFGQDIDVALRLLLLTGQRRRPVATALVQDFVPWVEEPGWGVWSMGPAHRKTADRRGDAARHAIPLPQYLWATVQDQVRLAQALGSPYLFPRRRAGRAGREGPGHMSPSVLNHRLADLGIRASPHDLRRAMSTTMQRTLRIPRSDVKLVMDHAEGIGRGDTLELHYTDDDRLHLKAPVVLAWVEWCYERVEDVADRLPERADLRRMLTETRKRRTAAGLGRTRSHVLLPAAAAVDPATERRRLDERHAATQALDEDWHYMEEAVRKRVDKARASLTRP